VVIYARDSAGYIIRNRGCRFHVFVHVGLKVCKVPNLCREVDGMFKVPACSVLFAKMLPDWPIHRQTCRIAEGSSTLRNMKQFEPAPCDSTKNKNQVVIDKLNYIFHEMPADSRDAAVAKFIREIKL